jgi:hypothetical protein
MRFPQIVKEISHAKNSRIPAVSPKIAGSRYDNVGYRDSAKSCTGTLVDNTRNIFYVPVLYILRLTDSCLLS